MGNREAWRKLENMFKDLGSTDAARSLGA